jgi:DNA-binding CsgD family transcriptional regulator
VTISDLFDMKTIEAASFESALDSFSFGILLVDEKLGILHANRTAQAMLAARDPIRSEKGTLTLPVGASEDALARAVRDASRGETALEGKGIGIPARRERGEPCVIHVLPLRRSERKRGMSQRATAILFVAPATAPPHMPADALALLYDLTPSEGRIFELIAAGKTQAAIATTLGIAPSTVKSHLLHLFAKTGTQRQADLVRLAAHLSAPA